MNSRSPLAITKIIRRPSLSVPLALSAAVALTAAGGSPGASAGPAAGAAIRAGHAATATQSWKIVKTVRGTNFPHFTALTATSRHGAWAFEATSSATQILKPLAWRLHASRWTRATFPGKTGEQVISAASTSPGDVWALLISAGRSRALRWNGHGWAVTGRFRHALGDVVALSRRDAWLFGDGAWHFNGHRWAHPRSGHGLLGGSALSPDSVWAFGHTVVARWNGHTWSRTSVKGLLPPKGQLNDPGLTSIYAQSADSVWAVGTAGEESQGGPVVLLHFNGHRWRRAVLADVGAGFPGQVIPDGSGGLWVPFGFVFQSFKMLHYTGGKLRQVALPAPAGTVLQVADAAAVPGTTRAFAAGGAWPAKGPIGGYTRAVILGYGRQAHRVTAYVANGASRTVTPIRTATNTALKPVKVGIGPRAIAITPDGKTAYVANCCLDTTAGHTVTPIRTATNTALKPIRVGDAPTAIAITPDGKSAYVLNFGSNTVTPIRTATNTAGKPIQAGTTLLAIAITPDGKTAYAANGETKGTVTPIRTATNKALKPIQVGDTPGALAITPDGKILYAVNGGSDTVTPIQTATNTPGKPIKVGRAPSAIAITPDGKTAYVVNTFAYTVTPIRTATNTAGKPIRIFGKPTTNGGITYIAITPDGKTAYVLDNSRPTTHTITPIRTATNTALKPINVGLGPVAIAITPDGRTAYVVNNGSGTVTPIRTATSAALAPIKVGSLPDAIAITP